MFRPIALYIGLRYTRAKRRNHFISFISLTSLLGIALGVMVLITVLSVMNGFDQEIRHRILGMARQVSISGFDNTLKNWRPLLKRVVKIPGVLGAAPYVDGQGMLVNQGQVHPVAFVGISPSEEKSVSDLNKYITEGSLDALQSSRFGVVIGQSLADALGVDVGARVTLITPVANLTPVGVMPRFKPLRVVGIFKAGNGFGFDNSFAFLQLNDAQKIMQLTNNRISGIRLKIADIYQAPGFSKRLAEQFPNTWVTDWTQTYGGFFAALKLEKTMMFLMLMLIIAVATFNLVSTLIMVVTDKQADIAILRTLGATPSTIMSIFMIQGVVIGVIGTLLGCIGGIALATHVTSLSQALENYFHIQLISADVYYVNYLPSLLLSSDVMRICGLSLLLSFCATIYPAWRASRVQPAEALRYE